MKPYRRLFKFSKKDPGQKKVWGVWHLFPFGKYKGVPLGKIADIDPGHLEWWQENSKVLFTDELKMRITNAKNLSK